MVRLPNFLRNLLKTHPQTASRNIEPPLFITGLMRSGTTFLVSKVVSHPQLLKVGDELDKVWDHIGGAQIGAKCVHKTEEDASSEFTYQMSNYFFDYLQESKGLKRHLMRAANKYNKGFGRIFHDWENIIPVNKSPHLVNKMEYVLALFPTSKFVYIIRDIRGHSASMKVHFNFYRTKKGKVAFLPEHELDCWSLIDETSETELGSKSYPPNFALLPQMWIRLNRIGLLTAKKLGTDKVMVVQYEDLIENQENLMKKIFDFIGSHDKHRQETERIAGLKMSNINTTTKGNSLEKWKTTLTEEEKGTLNSCIEEHQSEYDEVLALTQELKVHKL